MFCNKCKKQINENETIKGFCPVCEKQVQNYSKNPTQNQEIILKVGNYILTIPFFLSLFMSVFVIFTSFLMALGASKGVNNDIEQFFNVGMNTILLILGISLFVSIIFNIAMGIFMHQKNKKIIYTGKYKSIRKTTYVLSIVFLGIWGGHRFIIGDNKGGAIRLIAMFVSFLMQLFFSAMPVASFCIISICISLSYSLYLSDLVIALSKVSDENKKIFI